MKILFHPLDAAGHINACVGMAQTLAKRGHDIHFMIGSAYAGQLQSFGFNELLLFFDDDQTKFNKTTNNVLVEIQNSMNQNATFLSKSGFLSNLSSREKLMLFGDCEFFQEILNRCCQYNRQIERWIQLMEPDLIVVDHILIVPSILRSGIPWILLYSSNPQLLYNSKLLPPFSSGFATYDDNQNKESWNEYRECLQKVFITQMNARQQYLMKTFPDLNNRYQSWPPPTDPEQILLSPYLNLYGYPEELDYQDVVPRPGRMISVDAFCRDVTEKEEQKFRPLVQQFRKSKVLPGDKLVYVSLGSMGAVDLDLMKRLVEILGKTKHRYIVSKGPRHREFELADNMWGDEYVPQTMILPMVDLVITHGGNNTITESFSFGKPMIVMPLFADQYDNAQRIQEKGFGIRLETYDFTEQEMIDSIDKLLNNVELNHRLAKISKRIQQDNSKEKAAIKIEQMVKNNRQ